jgi:hypothetical protein
MHNCLDSEQGKKQNIFLLAFKNSFIIHVLQGRGFCAEFIMPEFLPAPPTGIH